MQLDSTVSLVIVIGGLRRVASYPCSKDAISRPSGTVQAHPLFIVCIDVLTSDLTLVRLVILPSKHLSHVVRQVFTLLVGALDSRSISIRFTDSPDSIPFCSDYRSARCSSVKFSTMHYYA